MFRMVVRNSARNLIISRGFSRETKIRAKIFVRMERSHCKNLYKEWRKRVLDDVFDENWRKMMRAGPQYRSHRLISHVRPDYN